MTLKQPVRNNKFRKAERLCSTKALEELYAQGEAFLVYPIRCVYHKVNPTGEPLRVMITAPKRNHKRAVDRNLLKRRVREVYRLNRNDLKEIIQANGGALEFSLTYIAKDIVDYHTIENAVKKILKELANRCAAVVD